MSDYDQSDVEVVFRRGDWKSWDDVVSWLEHGLEHDEQADNELSEAESRQLVDGFRRLKQNDETFSTDPKQVYKALQRVSN